MVEFSACADLDPSHTQSHSNLGIIYTEHLENFELVKQHYDKYFQNPTEVVNDVYFQFTKVLYEYCRSCVFFSLISVSEKNA